VAAFQADQRRSSALEAQKLQVGSYCAPEPPFPGMTGMELSRVRISCSARAAGSCSLGCTKTEKLLGVEAALFHTRKVRGARLRTFARSAPSATRRSVSDGRRRQRRVRVTGAPLTPPFQCLRKVGSGLAEAGSGRLATCSAQAAAPSREQQWGHY